MWCFIILSHGKVHDFRGIITVHGMRHTGCGTVRYGTGGDFSLLVSFVFTIQGGFPEVWCLRAVKLKYCGSA